MRSTRITHLSIPVLLAVFTLAACGSSSDTQASLTEPPTTNPTTTAAAVTTTAAETTTTETTTTEAVTTTVTVTIAGPTLTAADLVLNADGIGPLMFGDAADSTIAALASALGTPTEDTTFNGISCSSSDACNGYGDGYTDESFDRWFVHPFDREVCFVEDQLCASFGGSSADDLAFVGWVVGGWERAALPIPFSTADGVTIGSTLADFEAIMSIADFGCMYYGYGDTGGVKIRFIVTDGMITPAYIDPDSTEAFEDPSPDAIVVERLSAGDRPYPNGGDCPG